MWLAARKKIGALVLISAFTSIRAVAKSLAGGVIQFLVKDRFRNIDLIKKVTAPTFLVHGKKDELIPYSHSQQLAGRDRIFVTPDLLFIDACKGPTELVIPD